MENKINIAEILKDCPKGMKLYSPLCGECYFDRLNMGTIICKKQNTQEITFTSGGYYMLPVFDGCECVLFPSKENRDWSKFQKPFKDGDILINGLEDGECNPFIFKQTNGLGNAQCYCAINCFEELILNSDNWTPIKGCRLATEEEKQKLFDAINENGYKWNEETKTLEELNKNKFDIANLKPFEKVLVRQNVNGKWGIDFFGFYTEGYYYTTGSCIYVQCIPYEGNEHLIGTTEKCDEYYKTWE